MAGDSAGRRETGAGLPAANRFEISSLLVQAGLDERIVGGASQLSAASAHLPEGHGLLQTADVALRFVDV